MIRRSAAVLAALLALWACEPAAGSTGTPDGPVGGPLPSPSPQAPPRPLGE